MDRDREKEQLLKRLSMCETEEDSERHCDIKADILIERNKETK